MKEFRVINILFPVILFFITIVATYAINYFGGPFSWDDGTITLAFGRSIFEYGTFSLTESSPIVEGSSSILYTFMMGAIIYYLELDFYQSIEASRYLTAIFLWGTSFLIYLVVRPAVGRAFGFILAALYLAIPVNYYEVYNGMEMHALAFLLLLYVYLTSRGKNFALLVLPLIVISRIEGGFYLLTALTLAFVFSDHAERRRYFLHILVTVFVLTVLQIFRVLYFESFFPNTVTAKMNPPYSSEGVGDLFRKVTALVDALKLYAVPVTILIMLIIFVNPKRIIIPGVSIILSFFLFNAIAGTNWGYTERMTLAMLPIFLFTILYFLEVGKEHLFKNFYNRRVVAGILALTIGGYVIASFHSSFSLMRDLSEAYELQKMRGEDVSNLNSADPFSYGDYGITPENYKLTGEAVQSLAAISNLRDLKFAAPDVGGLGLCCSEISVVDLALLTNPELAKYGYGFLEEQLLKESPHFIQIHGIWSESSGIYHSPHFLESYRPLFFANTLFYARTDIIQDLVNRDLVDVIDTSSIDWGLARYIQNPDDQSFVSTFQKVYSIVAAERDA